MDGFDILLVGFGILGLLLTGVATIGKRPPSETASIGLASLGVLCVGLGGTSGILWLMLGGVALLAGAFWLEWYNRKRSA